MIAKSILTNRRVLSLWIMAAVYLAAGVNHFRMPEFYYPLIPPYIGNAAFWNLVSGIAEIAGGIGLLIPALRRWAAWGIVAMLIGFLPTHIYMITDADTILIAGSKIPAWVAWVRLLVIHPILLWWAWGHSRVVW
jgi:uncharacterized membrane protein